MTRAFLRPTLADLVLQLDIFLGNIYIVAATILMHYTEICVQHEMGKVAAAAPGKISFHLHVSSARQNGCAPLPLFTLLIANVLAYVFFITRPQLGSAQLDAWLDSPGKHKISTWLKLKLKLEESKLEICCGCCCCCCSLLLLLFSWQVAYYVRA